MKKRSGQQRSVIWIAIGVGVVVAAFLVGRSSGASSAARVRSTEVASRTPSALNVTPRRLGSAAGRQAGASDQRPFADGGVPRDGGSNDSVQRLVGTLLHHAEFNARQSPDAPLEQIANSVQSETRGIALVADTYPAVAADLHDEMRVRLCGEDTSDVGRVVLLRMMLTAPGTTDPVGIDCVLAHERTENFILWTALQIRQVARLPPTPETERWAALARNGHTRRLLGEARRSSGPMTSR